MQEKVILVTGATDGIGRQTALELAKTQVRVLVHGRDRGRVDDTVREIQKESKNFNVEPLVTDLSIIQQVRGLAAKVKEKCEHVDVLINNAGVIMPERTLTPDGLETTFVVNYLAPFLLTQLLLPLLQASPAGRIINVSSNVHLRVQSIDFDNLQGEKRYHPNEAYALSKLGNVLFSIELAERLKTQKTKITSNALHPGVISTKLLRTGYQSTGGGLVEGAETPFYLATSPAVQGVTGQYFVRKQTAEYSALAKDAALRARLWQTSAELAGLPT